MLRSKQQYSHKHLRNQQNPSWNVTTKQRERPNPLNFKKHPKHLILVGMSKFSNNTVWTLFFRWIHLNLESWAWIHLAFSYRELMPDALAVFEVGKFKKNQPRIYIYIVYIYIICIYIYLYTYVDVPTQMIHDKYVYIYTCMIHACIHAWIKLVLEKVLVGKKYPIEQRKKKPWLSRVSRGLYYPVMWGL